MDLIECGKANLWENVAHTNMHISDLCYRGGKFMHQTVDINLYDPWLNVHPALSTPNDVWTIALKKWATYIGFDHGL